MSQKMLVGLEKQQFSTTFGNSLIVVNCADMLMTVDWVSTASVIGCQSLVLVKIPKIIAQVVLICI